MTRINRRDFLKKGGIGIMTAATSNLWFDRLFAGQLPSASTFFSDRFGITQENMKKILGIALSKGGDFSELFFEYNVANTVQMSEDIIKQSAENISLGIGIRVLNGDQTGYGYSSDLSFANMKQAAQTAAAIASSSKRIDPFEFQIKKPVNQVYDLNQPFHQTKINTKVDLVKEAYNAAKTFDPHIVKVQSILLDEIQYVTIANSEGLIVSDARPQARLVVVSVAQKDTNLTNAFNSSGGRVGLDHFQHVKTPAEIGKEASKEAVTLLSAVYPVAGEQTVVLGKDAGVMVHEAVGHPFEADGIRKKTSIFWDKLGQNIANPIVNIYEDPTIPTFRGSMNIDDEGTNTNKTPLVEK